VEVRIEQEELDAIKRSVLTSSRRLLVDSLDPANHLSYLRSKFVMTERDAEEINAPASRSARVEVFLDKLSLKGSEAYDEFQNSLCRDRTQLFILTSMTKTLELLKHKVREFKVQQQQELQRQTQEMQRAQQNIQPPPSHTFYTQTPYHQHPTQKPGCYSPPVSPRPSHPQRPTHGAGHSVAGQPQHQGIQFQPTPAQQAQRQAYCQQRLSEMNRRQNHAHQSPHSYQSQQSMGFSPPPHYQSHTFTIPQPPPPHAHHHQRHIPPRQTPPNFQSRDGPADDLPPPSTTYQIENHYHPNDFTEGLPPESITSPPDMHSGQPCGQPS
jgi:hypothetical protein